MRWWQKSSPTCFPLIYCCVILCEASNDNPDQPLQSSNSSSPPVTFPCRCSYIPHTAVSRHQIVEISHTKHSLQHFEVVIIKSHAKDRLPLALEIFKFGCNQMYRFSVLRSQILTSEYAMVLVTQSMVAFSRASHSFRYLYNATWKACLLSISILKR